jgi:peptide-methionine (S)-S-oxide reductase
MLRFRKPATPTSAQEALPGRTARMPVPEAHHVSGARLEAPFPEGMEIADFGMGCFWGAERIFWQAPGVYSTSVGYAGGFTPNPTYEEVSALKSKDELVAKVQTKYALDKMQAQKDVDAFAKGRQL